MTTTKPMEPLLSGAKAGLVIICGILATRIPLNLASINITEETTMELKTIAAIGVFGGTVVWWLGRKFQQIDDRLDSLESKRQKRKDYEG